MNFPDDYMNKVICGDCLEIMKDIPDKSVDLVLTDPPYGVRKEGISNDQTLWAYEIDYRTLLKKDGILIMFTSTKYLKEVLNFVNLPYKWQFIWYCSNNMIPVGIGFAKYTSVLIFSEGSVFRNAQDCRENPAGTIELKKLNHPTPKPIKIVKYLAEKFSKVDETILDPFLGSGTTAVAAKQLGRNFIGIEINSDYCKIAEDRLRQTELFTSKPEIKQEQMTIV